MRTRIFPDNLNTLPSISHMATKRIVIRYGDTIPLWFSPVCREIFEFMVARYPEVVRAAMEQRKLRALLELGGNKVSEAAWTSFLARKHRSVDDPEVDGRIVFDSVLEESRAVDIEELYPEGIAIALLDHLTAEEVAPDMVLETES